MTISPYGLMLAIGLAVATGDGGFSLALIVIGVFGWACLGPLGRRRAVSSQHRERTTIMRSRVLALLLGTPALLLIAMTPSSGGADDELSSLKKEVEALKEGQKALERDLQDIKGLLRTRVFTPEPRGPQEMLASPVVLNVDGAPFLGNKEARVVLVEFSDFQCPFCARHSQQTLPAIVKEYVEAGKVKYVLRDFPIPTLHPRAEKSHEAAHCSGEQGKYWEMHDRLFRNLRGQEPQELTAHARALRLDVRTFEQCLTSERYQASVQNAVGEGQRAGVRGTPTFFLGVSGNGRTVKAARVLRGAQPYETFKTAIDAVLFDAR